MTATADAATDPVETGWSFGFVEDLDLPGWVFLPPGLAAGDQDLYVAEVGRVLLELFAETNPDGPPADAGEVHALLRAGLDARASSESMVMYQVWPLAGPASVLCHLNVVEVADLPDWTTLGGRIHAAEARHLGPGLQVSTRRVEEVDGGPLEVSAVHFAFADEQHAVVATLEEAPSTLVAQALVGFGLWRNALAVTREDGSRFSSTPPRLADEGWPIDEDEVS